MESLDQKLDKLSSDLDNVNELYEYAEQLYPYKQLREPRLVSFYRSSLTSSLG